VIRDVEHAFSRDGGLAVLYGNLAPDAASSRPPASTPPCSGSAPGHRVRERERRAIGILGGQVQPARGDHPLRGPRGGPHAGNAEAHRAPQGEGARHGLRARHRRALLGRDLRALDRARLARGGLRRRDRARGARRRDPVDIPGARSSSSWKIESSYGGARPWRPAARRPGGRRSRGSGSSRRRSGPMRALRLRRRPGGAGRGIDLIRPDADQQSDRRPHRLRRPAHGPGAVAPLSIFVRQWSAFRRCSNQRCIAASSTATHPVLISTPGPACLPQRLQCALRHLRRDASADLVAVESEGLAVVGRKRGPCSSSRHSTARSSGFSARYSASIWLRRPAGDAALPRARPARSECRAPRAGSVPARAPP